MAKLALITSTFIPAFALGAQSVNANNGFFSAVAITSFVIGCGQMVLFIFLR